MKDVERLSDEELLERLTNRRRFDHIRFEWDEVQELARRYKDLLDRDPDTTKALALCEEGIARGTIDKGERPKSEYGKDWEETYLTQDALAFRQIKELLTNGAGECKEVERFRWTDRGMLGQTSFGYNTNLVRDYVYADAIESLSQPPRGSVLAEELRDAAKIIDTEGWWCPTCAAIKPWNRVTFQENCADCGTALPNPSASKTKVLLERAADELEGWVSVEDADLSQRSDWLCYCWSDEQEYGLIDACQYVDGDFGMMTGWRVTHVRPLPPAPTQVGEER